MGSVRESILRLLLSRLEEIEHMRFTAIFTAILDSEKKTNAVSAYEAYFASAFPYIEMDTRRVDEQLLAHLQREVSAGPLNIRRLDGGVKSRLRKKPTDANAQRRSGRILSKIGRVTG